MKIKSDGLVLKTRQGGEVAVRDGWYWIVMGCLGIAIAGGWYPLWKSAVISPDSIRRRVYWTGSACFVLTVFLAELPNWRSGLFGATCFGLWMVVLALKWSGHVKINGRKFAISARDRRPDRPPALKEADRD